MQFKKYLQSKLPFFVALSFAFVLASCGSYQYVGYDNDGIYNSDEVTYAEEDNYEEAPSNSSYYKNYFAEKSQQYESLPEENVIFTDIDSYEGDYSEEEEYTNNTTTGYAGWGQGDNDVTINVYSNNGFGFYGYNSWWNSPYYSYGWYRPYRWNIGWGYGFYGYNSFWCPPYYSYGFYNNPYWYGYGNNFYGYNNVYSRRNVAYNAGRRGSVNALNNSRSSYSRRNSATISRRNNFSTRSNASTISRPRVNSTPRTNNNSSVRPRTNNSRPRVNSRPRTTTRPSVNSTPRRNNSVRNTPSRSSSSTISRGSSSSSPRSSSGGSSRRGRGN